MPPEPLSIVECRQLNLRKVSLPGRDLAGECPRVEVFGSSAAINVALDALDEVLIAAGERPCRRGHSKKTRLRRA